jgi:CDP-diacylglycerol--serine O-phosphatidyltransferase
MATIDQVKPEAAVGVHDIADQPTKKVSMHIYILPNLVTTGNLFFGFYAIIQAVKGDFLKASHAIVIAAIFDLMDGRLARLTRSTSKFGAEYDSLSDLVSFGMAPGLLLYYWALVPFGRIGFIACFLYVACGALRLARFNVQAHVVEKNYFQGLPIPMAAGIVASSVLAFRDLDISATGNIALLIMTFLLAVVMVSNFRYRSFKDIEFKERMHFKFLVAGVLLISVILYRPEVNLFLLFLSYAVLGAVFGFLKLGKNVRKIRANAYFPKESHAEQDLVFEEEEDLEKEAKDKDKSHVKKT